MNPPKGAEAKKLFLAVNKVAGKLAGVETVVCPPLIYLESLGQLVTTRSCVLGAQDAFWEHSGAFTGQVSPDMVFNARARYVMVGHSERRAMGETDEVVNRKIGSILRFPLIPIVCVGEKVRDEDLHYVRELKHQIKGSLKGLSAEGLSRVVIAYEPVWAISSNRAKPSPGVRGRASAASVPCTPAMCRETIQMVRQVLADLAGSTDVAERIPVLYGGSVNSEDVEGFITEGLVDGVLVGHASLEPKEFSGILKKVDGLSRKA